MPILIVNGTVVNDDGMRKADVLIVDNKIISVGDDLRSQAPDDARIIDATDRLIIPGGIDPHTHMQLPTMGHVTIDDFYSGTRAAVAGGTTMIIDFVVPQRDTTPLEAYKRWRSWADPKVCCDFAFSVAISSWNDRVQHEMEILTKSYGINAYKFYMAYPDEFMVTDDQMFHGMRTCRRIGALARVHAENGLVIDEKAKLLLDNGVTEPKGHPLSRPEQLEAEAANRACVIAEQAGCPLYVVHVMSKSAAAVIAHYKKKGNIVFGEPLAVGLATDGSHYFSDDFEQAAGHVMSPPLSTDPTTPVALMEALARRELDLTGTDNCTFTCQQKRSGIKDFTKIPNGINGVEDRMSIVWEKGVHSGKIDPCRYVEITSATAAKIFNIYPRKGRIQAGSDADVVIWNPKATRVVSKHTHHQATDFNVFEGMELHGVAEYTISRGKVVWENGKLNVEAGSGRFVPCLPFSNYVYGKLEKN